MTADELQNSLAGRMTIRPTLVNHQGAFGSDLEHESEDRDKEQGTESDWVSDAEHEWEHEMEEHYDFQAPEEFKWEEASDYGLTVPRGGLSREQKHDLVDLYARSSPVDEAIWYAVNVYHWHEADWLDILSDKFDPFEQFMATQRKYYLECLTDSQLIGQTAECAGVEQTKAAMKRAKERENTFGGL